MKKKITNTACVLAIVAGLAITTFGHGLAAFLGGFMLIYAAAVTLLNSKGYVRNV